MVPLPQVASGYHIGLGSTIYFHRRKGSTGQCRAPRDPSAGSGCAMKCPSFPLTMMEAPSPRRGTFFEPAWGLDGGEAQATDLKKGWTGNQASGTSIQLGSTGPRAHEHLCLSGRQQRAGLARVRQEQLGRMESAAGARKPG